MSYRKILFSFFAFFVFFVFSTPKALASTLHLTPGSTRVGVGGIVSVTVRLSTAGESINGVSAYLSYPSDVLDVASLTYGSSAFPIAAEGTSGGGSIRISRGNITGVNGTVNVATINFRGKKTGTATISFVGGSAAPRASDSSDSLNLGGSSGGVITVDTKTAVSTTSKDGPVISGITTTNISTQSAEINWKTDTASDSTVDFGLEKGTYLFTINKKEFVTAHSIKLENVLLIPGSQIHYRVSSQDRNGNEKISDDSVLQLLGYQVKLIIQDQNQKAVNNAQVTFYNTNNSKNEVIANENGEVVLQNVSPGIHVVKVLVDGKETVQEIIVQNSESEQTFTIQITNAPIFTLTQFINILPSVENFLPLFLAVIPYIVGIVIFIILGLFLKSRVKNFINRQPSQMHLSKDDQYVHTPSIINNNPISGFQTPTQAPNSPVIPPVGPSNSPQVSQNIPLPTEPLESTPFVLSDEKKHH